MFRITFLIFMTWLLVWFLPSHTRGRITMGPKDADSCCAPKEPSCCAGDDESTSTDTTTPTHEKKPTAKDRANCAVCFWAAGLLHTIPVSFTMIFLERHHEHLARLATQCRSVYLPREVMPRGPPVAI